MTQLLERAHTEGTPLIDGEKVTFIWEGVDAPHLIGDFNDWEDDAPVELAAYAPGIWTHSLTLPHDSYVEYAYTTGERRILDPYNRRKISNGMGRTNQFFYTPGGGPTPLIKRDPGIPQGKVTRHSINAEYMIATSSRKVYLYRPPVDEAVPLVVVYDGWDYYKRAKLPQIVDNLIAQKRIRPIALAMVQNGGKARSVEYCCNDMLPLLLQSTILPLAQEHLKLIDVDAHPGAYGVLGASMGGLSALFTGLRLPHIFGNVLSQSGAFSLWDYDFMVYDLVRHGTRKELKIWMDVGTLEWLHPANQTMHKLLREKGYPVTYREYHGGHNYTCWRNDVANGLEHIFG